MNLEEQEISGLFNKIADEKENEDLKNFYNQLKQSIDFSINNKSFHFDSTLLNSHENINLHLRKISKTLKNNSFYLTKAITLEDWRVKNKKTLKIPLISFSFRIANFTLYRVIPRIKVLNFIKRRFFRSNKVLLSKAEILGRLSYNGFEIHEYCKLNDYHIFCSQKIHNYKTDSVSEGPIFTQKRMGKNGKTIYVYKLRTMHPYSEYIHKYMLTNHGFSPKGKINNDFRMTRWAKVFRKYWLDEIPQVLNLFKGNMKLVGFRPVSESYYEVLPDELKKMRSQFKPGCIPPYVSLNMKSTFEDVL
ncbi:MAG: sugar transferase, partial [Crocinitomicaceae bacterium]|nr:sugar transferase [Crocinitomicaceae bacterium]